MEIGHIRKVQDIIFLVATGYILKKRSYKLRLAKVNTANSSASTNALNLVWSLMIFRYIVIRNFT